MFWFWLNMPLAAVFFGAWYGIPMWLIHKRPGWGSAPVERHQAAPAGPQTAVAAQYGERLVGVS
ncbi:MAG TPA: hypothetical protein VEC76_03290 [Streptosporangiaceae bacterium]|nr:hypothetical protein [Streptosporangiaceae bacterium]